MLGFDKARQDTFPHGRIVRGKDGCSANVAGLYPAGEGSGYAGGIVSSAIDGIRAAEAVLKAP